FTGVNQSALIYSAQQSSGLKLPDWLRFNETTRRLSGRPNATVAGRYELAIMATTPVGAQAVANFSLIAEYFPEVLQSILPSLADINSAFSFTVPVNTFIDRDGDPLTYVARCQNGAALPNWLTFNPQSLSFSGVPLETDEENLSLQIIATDLWGASVGNNLTIQVVHFPIIARPQSVLTIRAGQSFNFSLPQDTFTDADHAGLAYSIEPSLPSWLSFDNQTLSFSGATSPVGVIPLTLVATDQRGAKVRMDFQLVARGEVPPTALEDSLSNQAATVGRASIDHNIKISARLTFRTPRDDLHAHRTNRIKISITSPRRSRKMKGFIVKI
ncbi:MAG: putative Ig domain-containing protein, partial [Proteobacteria bacterium]|nr:putative Ig domain-containing protein [Pseudomonadota bacterium]